MISGTVATPLARRLGSRRREAGGPYTLLSGPGYQVEEFLDRDVGQGANGVVITHDGGSIGLGTDGTDDSAE